MPTTYKKNYIILHHTITARDTTTFEAVNNYHKGLWNFESSLGFFIGYHYFIDGKGKVYQGRNDWEAGAHCYQENKNYDSIGICLTGNFDTETPSQAQTASLGTLLKDLMQKHLIPKGNIKFHRDYAGYKSCPGTNIKTDFIDKLLNNSIEDTMKLIQKKGGTEVYAVDKFRRRHAILNWDTFQRGLAMGLWNSEIEQVNDFSQYAAGNVIILAPDN